MVKMFFSVNQLNVSIRVCLILAVGGSCLAEQKRLSSADGDFEVAYYEYAPEDEQPVVRTVVIFPPTGGITCLDKSYARKIKKRGVRAIVLSDWTGKSEDSLDLRVHQRLHERAMRALDLVLQEINNDHHHVSVMGTSVGALFVAVAASRFDEIDTVMAIAGGIPISSVIAYSNYKTMKTLREQRFTIHNYNNKEEYVEAVCEVFALDPQKLPTRFLDKRRAIVVLSKDKAVPTQFQEALRVYWQPEKVITIDSGHFWGIFKAWLFHSDEIVDFLVGAQS